MCVFPCCKGSSGGTSGSGADDEEEVSGTEPGEEDEEQQPESEGPISVKIPKTLLPSKVSTGTVKIDFGNGVLTMNVVDVKIKEAFGWQAEVKGELDVPALHLVHEAPFRVSGTLSASPEEDGVILNLSSNSIEDGEVEFSMLKITFNEVSDDRGVRQGLAKVLDGIQVRYGVSGMGASFNGITPHIIDSGSVLVTFP